MKLSVRQGSKKMSRNIVQINNRFIQDENQRRRYLDEERRKRNRFMGWVLILVMLLFILPAYNLYQSYETLLNRRAQYAQLQKKYEAMLPNMLVPSIPFQKKENIFTQHQIYYHNNHGKFTSKYREIFIFFG